MPAQHNVPKWVFIMILGEINNHFCLFRHKYKFSFLKLLSKCTHFPRFSSAFFSHITILWKINNDCNFRCCLFKEYILCKKANYTKNAFFCLHFQIYLDILEEANKNTLTHTHKRSYLIAYIPSLCVSVWNDPYLTPTFTLFFFLFS
jgi:hypothetical protein